MRMCKALAVMAGGSALAWALFVVAGLGALALGAPFWVATGAGFLVWLPVFGQVLALTERVVDAEAD